MCLTIQLQLQRFRHVLWFFFDQVTNEIETPTSLQNVVMRKGRVDGSQHPFVFPDKIVVFQIKVVILVTETNIQGCRSEARSLFEQSSSVLQEPTEWCNTLKVGKKFF
jgi:hypothetical protein